MRREGRISARSWIKARRITLPETTIYTKKRHTVTYIVHKYCNYTTESTNKTGRETGRVETYLSAHPFIFARTYEQAHHSFSSTS